MLPFFDSHIFKIGLGAAGLLLLLFLFRFSHLLQAWVNRLTRAFSGVILIAPQGREIWFQRADDDRTLTSLPLTMEVPSPTLPPAHLSEAEREALTTHRHLEPSPRTRYVMERGDIVDDSEWARVIREGIKACRTRWWHRLVKPVVIIKMIHATDVMKRTVLYAAEVAGAGKTFLTEATMTALISGDAPVTEMVAMGVIMMEHDYTQFAVAGHADILCEAYLPWGLDDLEEMDDPLLAKMTNHFATAMEDLRELHHRDLAERGVWLMGAGAQNPALAQRLSEQLGLKVIPRPDVGHGMIQGLRVYAAHIDEWPHTRKLT